MTYLFNLLLFVITLIGGLLPLRNKDFRLEKINTILAFSGSFLLAVTLLHLIPETFTDIGSKAGLYLLIGFFIQLVIQRYTHGVEHGHIHVHHHGEKMALSSVIIGLSLHAAMEGIPLGFNYHSNSTEPALYLAIATHKFPEAILVASLLIATGNRTKIIPTIVFFSAITPVTAILAHNLGIYFLFVSTIISVIIPIVAGAFLHIATTIFFESGTKHHMLTNKKILAILLGVGLGLLTTLIHD